MDAQTPFVGEIGIAGFNFAPTGWAFCNGQLLPISQNTALFSLLGTFYGGDGKSTFALPNLQGAVAIHQGQGPGLSEHFLGESSGSETFTLLESEMPAHSHGGQASGQTASLTQPATTQAGTTNTPEAGVPANSGTRLRYAPTANGSMAPYTLSTQVAGGGLPFSQLQPYLTLNFMIALQGVFPPRG